MLQPQRNQRITGVRWLVPSVTLEPDAPCYLWAQLSLLSQDSIREALLVARSRQGGSLQKGKFSPLRLHLGMALPPAAASEDKLPFHQGWSNHDTRGFRSLSYPLLPLLTSRH